jgi:hypothetical protein
MLEVILNERATNKDCPTVSVNGTLKRILINGRAMEMISEHFGKEVSHVTLLRDPKTERCLWIRAATPEERGARSLGSTKGSTKLVSCAVVLRLIGYNETKTSSFPIFFDSENQAFKIDMKEVKT